MALLEIIVDVPGLGSADAEAMGEKFLDMILHAPGLPTLTDETPHRYAEATVIAASWMKP